jgi:hypothetical protein
MCNSNSAKSLVHVSSIVISKASLVFVMEESHLFSPSPSSLDLIELSIVDGSLTAMGEARLSGLRGTFLQIGNVGLPENQ